MTKHFTEADLLETYYMRPDESAPVMRHLATCDECIARYNRLERKLREAASCSTKPATFWSFQRGSIMRRVDAVRRDAARAPRTLRVAAAALLAFLLGGAVVYETVRPQVKAPAPTAVAAVAPAAASTATAVPESIDPWESDELQDFHAVVQWESWVADSNGKSKREKSL